MINPNKIERYIVSAYPYKEWLDDWIRVYKTRRGAEKRYKELIEDYEVGAKMEAWYPDFSESKAGRFLVIKKKLKE